MRLAPALAAILLAAAVLAPSATAQGVELALDHDAPAKMTAGASRMVSFTVAAHIEDVYCAAATSVPLHLTVDTSRAVDGFALDALPASVDLPLPIGAHTSASPGTSQVAFKGDLLVARYVPGGTIATVILGFTFGEPPTECVAAPGALEAAQAFELVVTIESLPKSDPAFHPEHEIHGATSFEKYLAPGERFSHTFDAPGRYPYHDHLDPARKGMIRVLSVAEGARDPTIRITSTGFDPADLAIKAGTTVTWVNQANTTRTVSSDEQHDAPGTVEPEDRAALKAADAANAANSGAGSDTETPGPAPVILLITIAALAAARRRRGA